ncbi:MAG: hypothetical protein R6W75_12975 [Smithellaceae bacterium]
MNQKEDVKRRNEEIAQRFSKIEANLNAARSIPGVLETLLTEVEKEFRIPFVWLTFIEGEDTRPLIEAALASDFLKHRLNVVSSETFAGLLPDASRPVLVNRELRPFYRLLPASRKYFVKSLAVAPFVLNGRTAGSWNNGDASGDRFAPDMETGLIAALACALSRRLTELNTEKMR